MNKLIEFEGKDQLAMAVETVAADNPPDLVVVRELVTDLHLLGKLAQYRGKRDWNTLQDLYEEVPQFYEADGIIAERWATIGYPKLAKVGGITLDIVRYDEVEPHIDGLAEEGNEDKLEAIALASLCLDGKRKFKSEVLPITFQDYDGNVDLDDMKEFNKLNGEFWNLLESGRQPRTETDVYAGDMVLFPHHPNVTLHSVEHDEGSSSIARLLCWYATCY